MVPLPGAASRPDAAPSAAAEPEEDKEPTCARTHPRLPSSPGPGTSSTPTASCSAAAAPRIGPWPWRADRSQSRHPPRPDGRHPSLAGSPLLPAALEPDARGRRGPAQRQCPAAPTPAAPAPTGWMARRRTASARPCNHSGSGCAPTHPSILSWRPPPERPYPHAAPRFESPRIRPQSGAPDPARRAAARRRAAPRNARARVQPRRPSSDYEHRRIPDLAGPLQEPDHQRQGPPSKAGASARPVHVQAPWSSSPPASALGHGQPAGCRGGRKGRLCPAGSHRPRPDRPSPRWAAPPQSTANGTAPPPPRPHTHTARSQCESSEY